MLEFPDGAVRASTIGEIRVAVSGGRDDGFYDFETKYIDDVAELDVPADVDVAAADELRPWRFAPSRPWIARAWPESTFLTEDGPVVNEINTMPGFTTISMYPRMWEASGVDYQQLVTTMVETALARGTGLR